MKIEIVKPRPEDIDAINTVYHKTWLDVYPNEELGITVVDIQAYIPEELQDEERARRMLNIQNVPDDRYYSIARVDNQVVGVCGGRKTETLCQLQSIYVLPEYQGKGVGKALWTQFYVWADRTKPIIVHVATYNENAIKFYKKLGFEDTGKRFTEARHTLPSGATIPEMEMILPVSETI